MNTRSVSFLVAAALIVGVSLTSWLSPLQGQHSAPVAAPAAAASQHIVVNLKHATDDLHATFMALKIAGGLQAAGAQVSLFVNLEGARLADKRMPADMTWGQSPATIGELMAAFVDKGGKVVVCPHCAKAAGLAEADLVAGATIADHDGVVALFLEADKVIDY